MAKLSRPRLKVIDAIYQRYEEQQRQGDNAGLPSSYMAHECDRFHWYAFRWAGEPQRKAGRILRLFETGRIEEDRIIADLKSIGCEVQEHNPETDRQWKRWLLHGHVVVKPDGLIRGVPDAPKKWHTLECKTAKATDYNAIVKHGLRAKKMDHFIQCQLQMHAFGVDRCLYIIKNKDTDELHGIRLHHDRAFCDQVLQRADKIISSDWAPPRLHDDPEAKAAWQCRFCDYKDICHGGKFARVNCRTCLHVKMVPGGKWVCTKHDLNLSYDDQQAGCDDHLYLPDLVPGRQVDTDGQTVTYELPNGGKFTDDGRDKNPQVDSAV